MKTLVGKCGILIAGLLMMAGCLENNGGMEVKNDLNNGDFDVVTDPGSGSGGNGGDNGSSGNGSNPGTIGSDGFVINKGDTFTDNRLLRLDFYPPFLPAGIKVSANSNCSGGSWENFVTSKDYQSNLTNQLVNLSVQFRDPDGASSSCYARSILIDEAGPEIVFAKYPSTAVEEGSDVEIIFNVTDAGVGVRDVSCNFAGVNKTCAAGQNTVKIPRMAEGTYTLRVETSDKLNHSSDKSITFSVTSSYKQMAHKVNVKEYQKVDILFVIDNSGSMAYEQKSMASRVRNFLDVVKGLDWQIAVTTTDPRNITLGDGRLVPLKGLTNQYILTSAMDDAQAKTILSNTLQRSETGSGEEQGILVAYRAIERSVAASGGNTNFIRSDAQLAVVLISDEDESANTPKNDPANLISYIQSAFNGQKSFSYHSVIARPGDKACLNGEGYSAGFRYEQISKLTGGVIGDVCASDYAAQVQGIAEGVRKTLKSITLACAPIVDANHIITVKKDGAAYGGSNHMEGQNLVFDQMLPAGEYEVLYTCLK